MKISNIQLRTEGERVRLTADCNIRHFGPDTVYFMFDKKYKDFIVADASAFAAAFLVPAMKLGESLRIEGSISEQLYHGLHESMKIMVDWNIGLKPIAIIVDTLEKDHFAAKRNASFFSGGVDSFFTYLKHKASGDQKIDYFILADGYDIMLADTKLWALTCETVDSVAEQGHIEVIKIESNVRDLIEPIMPWDYTFGGCLAALGLALRKELKNVFIPSAVRDDQLCPWGSHPDIDHLRGTETISFHHDGGDVTRLQKVRFIAKNPMVLKHLRVCFQNKENKYNCGVCDKCLRTMIGLRIAEALQESATFPRAIDLALVKKLKITPGGHGLSFHGENLAVLEELNMDVPLQEAIKEALDNSSPSSSRGVKIAKQIWFYDHLYNRGRIYKVVRFIRKKMTESSVSKS